MIKKILAAITGIAIAFTASSATAVGDWNVHNNFSYDVTKIIDTPGKVYYVAENNLFHYDKDVDETYGYTIRNGLNDVVVKSIYYNTDADYLLVVYQTGNIDLIYPDGEIVNMGDIASASQIADKTVNDVAFSGDKAYIAAGFGIAVFDTADKTVVESGIFNRNVSAVTIAGDRLLMVCDGVLYHAPLSGRHNTLDRFTSMGDLKAIDLEAVSADKVIYTDGADICAIIDLNFSNSTFTARGRMSSLVPYILKAGDKYLIHNYLSSQIVDENGRIVSSMDTPPAILSKDYRRYMKCHTASDENSRWYLSADGVGHYTIGSDGKVTIDRQASRPMGTYLKSGAWYMIYGESSGDLYLSNSSFKNLPRMSTTDNHMSLNVLSDGFIKDITPANEDVTLNNPNSHEMLKAGFQMVEDPEEPGVIYIGTAFEGMYKLKDGKQVAKYDWNNMPAQFRYMFSVLGMSFDAYCNLWIYAKSIRVAEDSEYLVAVLPAAKRKLDNVTASDWINLNPRNFGHTDTFAAVVYACRAEKSKNIVMITDGWAENKLLVYNSAGTGETVSDDTYRVWNSLTDQDGKSFGPSRIASFAEDKDGKLWVGTADGVIIIHDPVKMLDASATIERVKVPRNDGTQYADYLLDGQLVTSIAVDNANRKWLATASSGLYLVSADGKEILENFNVDNSYLPTNEILSVACDPKSNIVYVGTRYGLAEYSSDASPAAGDYSEIYAYPNPVRPDYGGWITVTGLMDGSLVKIADAAGNVFFQGRAEGGMITWDGCNGVGQRVKTGVYYVFASQSGDSGSSGAVTKIMVVN